MDNVPHLERMVADLLLAAGRLTRKLRAVSNATDLTWSQVAVMARIEAVGPMSIADLARAESVKPQSMGATLAILADRGFVDRRPDPADGRQILFALTSAGIAVRNAVSLAKHGWLLSAMSKLTDEERRGLTSAIATIQRVSDL